jgi:hypothetical protein
MTMPKNFTLRVVAIYPDTQKVEFSFTIEGFAEPWSFEIPYFDAKTLRSFRCPEKKRPLRPAVCVR